MEELNVPMIEQMQIIIKDNAIKIERLEKLVDRLQANLLGEEIRFDSEIIESLNWPSKFKFIKDHTSIDWPVDNEIVEKKQKKMLTDE